MFIVIGPLPHIYVFFFFNDTATTEIYTLSLHDALPICLLNRGSVIPKVEHSVISKIMIRYKTRNNFYVSRDRKSTRLNSSHSQISYAVFCLKKKNIKENLACEHRIIPALPYSPGQSALL